jgi:hypothetical protein
MLESHKIYLYDRIKETSYTIGTANFVLNGAANGFSSFGSSYENGESLFYAATDGTFYEVGSGIYVTGVQNSLIRFPFKSTNNNTKVNFAEGIKEVFVTYPATNSVYTASGLQGSSPPQAGSLAIWSSSNILNYDNKIVWDSDNYRLGINRSSPVYALDIGGNGSESIVRSSGLYIGSVGIVFPAGNNGDSSYSGGIQLTHYIPNALNSLTGIDHVIELSGVAKNNFLLKKQNAGLVFAGPASGCTPPCSPDYPTFRPMLIEDIHDLNADLVDNSSGLAIYHKIGINTSKLDGNVTSYNNLFTPSVSGSWIKSSYTASGLFGGAISLIDTVSPVPSSQYGYSIYTSASGMDLNISMGNVSGIQSQIIHIGTLNSIGVADPTTSTFNFSGRKIKIANTFTPTSSSGVGNVGEICWDSNYLYVCVAPNTWKRSYISTW